MKKHHDAAGLANELEGSSAFFQVPQPARSNAYSALPGAARPKAEYPGTQPALLSERSTERPSDRPTGRSVPRRQTQRRAFEFYRDQLQTFKAWAAADIAEGGEGNMSDWARQAFDDYIAKRNGDDRTSGRPAGRSIDRLTERRR